MECDCVLVHRGAQRDSIQKSSEFGTLTVPDYRSEVYHLLAESFHIVSPGFRSCSLDIASNYSNISCIVGLIMYRIMNIKEYQSAFAFIECYGIELS